MACWVVPAIAAEFWGVSIDHVMGQVRDGHVASKSEDGFLFVDVAPESLPFNAPQAGAVAPPPPTFALVTREEIEALGVEPESLVMTREEGGDGPTDADDAVEVDPPEEDGATISVERPQWDRVRAAVGRTRRPPLAA